MFLKNKNVKIYSIFIKKHMLSLEEKIYLNNSQKHIMPLVKENNF